MRDGASSIQWCRVGEEEVEAPGVEPGSRNAFNRASTGLFRHLSPRDRLRRTGSVVTKAEVILALGSYGADRSSQPGLMASHPPAPGEQAGEGAATRPPVRSCCSQSKLLPVFKEASGQPPPATRRSIVRSKPFRPRQNRVY